MDLLGCITRKLKRWFCPQARLNPRAHVALAGFPSSFGSWVLSSFSGKHFPQSDKNGPWQPLVHSWYTNYSPRKQELERCCILTPIGTLSCVNCRVMRVASVVVQNQILHSLAKYQLKIKKRILFGENTPSSSPQSFFSLDRRPVSTVHGMLFFL